MSYSPLPVTARSLPACAVPPLVRDPAIVEGYLEDASGSPPGRTSGLLRVASEAEAASFLRETAGRGVTVLPQAARSSLTAGAIPNGEVIVSVERLREIGRIERAGGSARVAIGAGVRLRELQSVVREQGLYYPPVPTYQEAMLGGSVSTNAGGAATFKYGVTRQWVRGLRVLLDNGDLVEIERGQALAARGECFTLRLSTGETRCVPAPDYRLPDVKKISAGYYASDPLDLVDLFVGSEGTLGLITEVTIDLAPLPASVVTGLVFLASEEQALALAADLRRAALEARRGGNVGGPDVRAIELMDGRSLDLLRAEGVPRSLRVNLPGEARSALLFEMELPEPTTNLKAQETLSAFFERRAPAEDSPLLRLFRILDAHGALAELELAFPEDRARQEVLAEFREAVPKRVSEFLVEMRRQDPAVRKVGGDLVVPFEHLAEMLRIYREGFERRGLSFAIWGHASDGNLHPNALPRNAGEVEAGIEALHEFAREAVLRGGCPLSEHGVGRSPVKQEILRRFLGDRAIASMKAIKRAIDPEGRFAPGSIFPWP